MPQVGFKSCVWQLVQYQELYCLYVFLFQFLKAPDRLMLEAFFPLKLLFSL